MRDPGVYVITNTESRRVYIGSTVNLPRRQAQHKHRLRGGTHDNPHLQNAWDKYGEAAFRFEVLEHLEEGQIYNAEQFWMDTYRKRGTVLYNTGPIARNAMLGHEFTEEHRRRLSNARKGRKLTEQHRRNIGEGLKGRKCSEETRRKISESNKGLKRTEETKRRVGRASRARRWTEEHRAKFREARMGHEVTAETRSKIAGRHARRYPAFTHLDTKEVIPAGLNLSAMCRERRLLNSAMCQVIHGKQSHHKGWVLVESTQKKRGEK